MRKKIILFSFIIVTITILSGCLLNSMHVHAATGDVYSIGVSPMTQKIILNPGEKYDGSFTINNPADREDDFYYTVSVEPFYVDENYNAYNKRTGNLNQIVDWVTLANTEGVLHPNDIKEIKFSINVPENAPAGGQYASISVQARSSNDEDSESSMGVKINQVVSIAHNIFAEISGTTIRHGEILSVDLPSFLFSGNIVGSALVKNTGNVHGAARYTMQVFPLFSSEEIYTNEENPQSVLILPDRQYYNELTWTETPPVGIFNVKYTVEFEGSIAEVSKMVIVCPIWLLFIIIFITVALIIWLVVKIRTHGKSKSRTNAE